MEWLAEGRVIYVFYKDTGTWAQFTDTWTPNDAAAPGDPPPPGRYRPLRALGKLWSTNPTVRQRLGWATAPEQPYTGVAQRFERGLLLHSLPAATIYVLFQDGAWAPFSDE